VAEPGTFTDRVRQELARLDLRGDDLGRAELAALLRFAGSLHLVGIGGGVARLRMEVETTSGAVARRTFALLQATHEVRAELRVRAPGGMRTRSTYGVLVGEDVAAQVALDVGLVDGEGRPRRTAPDELVQGERGVAYLRGAFVAAGSVSAPGRSPHLEVAVRDPEAAAQLLALVQAHTSDRASLGETARGHRVVVKSGEAIAELLTTLGATGAFLAWEEQRLRRQLRNDAQRLANADSANVRRAIDAAAGQIEAVERVLEEVGWAGLDEDLRQVALARLANPSASLAELGELCDPPVGKSAVHRRLRRIEELAEEAAEGSGTAD
jgi:DNA-binding protein WhiA